MLNKYFYWLILPLFIFLYSCSDYKKTESGLQFNLIIDSSASLIKKGEVAICKIRLFDEKDSLIDDTPFQDLKADSSQANNGSLEEALFLLSAGDSVSLKILADVFYQKTVRATLPSFIKSGSLLRLELKVTEVYSLEEVEKIQKDFLVIQQQQQATLIDQIKSARKRLLEGPRIQQKMVEEGVLIKKYLKKKGLVTELTENGVYFVKNFSSKKIPASPGDTVSIHYKGKFLDDQLFDSSEGKAPFSFVLGTGQVISGWDEALEKFAEGDQGIIIVPSPLGFMDVGVVNPQDTTQYVVPANTPLVFEVEIVNVNKPK